MATSNMVGDVPLLARQSDEIVPAAARIEWVDALKGIGILLVVLGHALGGLIDADFASGAAWFRPLFAAIYVFHMPLFFFLTGLFVVQRVTAKPDRFRQRLFTQVAWPYFLWGSIQLVAIHFAGSLVNHPGGSLGLALLQTIYAPPSQFWFLYALFFLHGLSSLVGRGVASPLYFILLLAAASFVEQQYLRGIWQPLFRMAPYYGLGVLLGPLLLARPYSSREHVWLLTIPLACIAGAAAMAYSLGLGIPGQWPKQAALIVADMWQFENFYAAVTIVAALVCITRFLGARAPRWLIYCGKQTMPIFVLHILFMASTRIFVLKFNPATPALILLPLLCLVGIILPLIAASIADRIGVSKWVGFR